MHFSSFARTRLGPAAVLALASALAPAQPAAPPAPPVKTVTDNYFGTTVSDPYRYFENLKDPGVAALMKAQADYTRAVLDRLPLRNTLLKEIATYGDAGVARVYGMQVNGDAIYFYKRLPEDNIGKLYVRMGAGGTDRLLVDPDAAGASKGAHAAIDWFAPSPDNKYLAYGLSIGGSEESVLHVKEVATGAENGEQITRARFGPPGWTADNRLLYNRLQAPAAGAPVTDKYLNSRVYLHKLGDDPNKDTALLGAGLAPDVDLEPGALPFVGIVPGSDYAVGLAVHGVQREYTVFIAPVASVTSGKPDWKKVVDPSDQVTDFSVFGNTLYLVSHKGASRFQVLRLAMATLDVSKAEVAIPASDSVVTGLSAAQDGLYVRRMNGSLSELLRLPYTAGSKPTALTLPYESDISAIATDVRVPGVVFDTSGWTRFGGVYAYDPRSNKVSDTGLQPQGPFDNPTDLVSTEVKVKSYDGTLVPMSIVHRKGLKLDGSNPTILYGYGAYGISQTPFYRPTFLPWFQRGGVLAVTHVRGGGEYGEDWHQAGYKLTKPNTWKDAIASGEWLVANGYTSSGRMSIMGGSAGGIFVGRSITERPDLFGAAIDQVPVSDALRAEFSSNGPPNIPEFGSVTTEEGFRGLYAMSAYHWIKDGTKYPAVLVTTGFNDPRVDSWQAAKMAARLQAATTSGKPVLLRIDYDAGHGLGSTKKQGYEERADTFAFLLWQAGLTEPVSVP
jgi:prolyl oligopeptidase